jgi:hypothetical protein
LIGICLNGLIESNLVGSLQLLILVVGPLTFFAATSLDAELPSEFSLKLISAMIVIIAILELFLPQFYESLASLLLSRYTLTDGSRGLSFLTPEPTYAALSLTYVLSLVLALEYKNNRTYLGLKYTSLAMLFMTFSTYAIVLLGAYLFVKYTKTSLLVTASMSVIFAVGGIIFFQTSSDPRFVIAISNLFAIDYSNVLASLSRIDPSLGTRLYSIAASYSSSIGTFVGFGLDCSAMGSAFTEFDYTALYENPVLADVATNGCLKPQSYLAALGLGLGSFSFLLALYFLIIVQSSIPRQIYGKVRWEMFFIAITILCLQSQMTNPIPWLILYLSLTCNEKNTIQNNGASRIPDI